MIIDQPSSAMTGKHTAALHIFTNVGLQQSYGLNPLLFPSVVYAFFQEFHMLFLMLVMCQLYVHNVVLCHNIRPNRNNENVIPVLEVKPLILGFET